MNAHPEESLPLYALGALDDVQAAAIDAHLSACERCTRELGRHEAVVAALDDAFVEPWSAPLPAAPFAGTRLRRAAFRSPAGFAAVAAALLFALGIGTDRLLTPHDAPGANDAALATIATSHFLHVSLRSVVPGAPPAKVLYARDGTWLYAIVEAPASAYRVRVRDRDRRERTRSLAGDAATGTLFEAHLARPAVTVDLLRADGTVVATGTLAAPAMRITTPGG